MTRRDPDRFTPWILALLVLLLMVPMNGLMHWTGLWALRPGFGQHPWGVAVLGVVAPSVAIVIIGYDRFAVSRQRRLPRRGLRS